ncbi:MAG: ABC transporter permease [Candidatus Hydrogenedentota bacterium]|nr:MAG: ABC transporter permease [Candidatus Hydrogenedentota bacterium]
MTDMSVSTLRVAWRNLGRNKRRTLLAVGAIALGQFTLLFVNGLMAGSFHNMLETVTGPLVGHVQIHHPEWREERAIDLYIDGLSGARAEIESLPDVKSVLPRIYSPVLAASGEQRDQPADAEPAVIVGVDTGAESEKGGLLERLEPEKLRGKRSVAVGRVLANRLDVEVGHSLAVIGQDVDGYPVSDLFKVTAIIESNVDMVKTMGIVMSIADAGELLAMPGQAHEIVVQGDDYRNAGPLAARISALPALADTEVLAWREAVPELVRLIDMRQWIDLIFLAIVFAAAAAGIANTATMSTFERTHEFGMLLAIGARPGRIVWIVLIESIALGLAGVAIGSVFGTATVLITSHTGINYAALGGVSAEDVAFGGISFSYIIHPVFEFRHIVFGLLAVTITSALASVWPAALAARLEPVKAMRL